MVVSQRVRCVELVCVALAAFARLATSTYDLRL
jgi:hypothetical protein